MRALKPLFQSQEILLERHTQKFKHVVTTKQLKDVRAVFFNRLNRNSKQERHVLVRQSEND